MLQALDRHKRAATAVKISEKQIIIQYAMKTIHTLKKNNERERNRSIKKIQKIINVKPTKPGK